MVHSSVQADKNLPNRVQKNCVLAINMEDCSLDDVKADGNGVYKNQGTFRWNYSINNGQVEFIGSKYRKAIAQEYLKTNVLIKTYFTHAQYPDFKREIFHVQNRNCKFVNNLCIVVYYFTGQEHKISLRPHGNSKANSSLPYTRKRPSIIMDIASKTNVKSTKRAVENYVSEHGGRSNIELQNLPTLKSIYDKRMSQGTVQSNSLSEVMEWATDNKEICRLIQTHPEPIIVIATDLQLNDLVRFGTGPYAKELSIDPTFNLGNFFVTPITYKNSFLETSKPYCQNIVGSFCGPVMIHFTKTKSTYMKFFETLKNLQPLLIDVKKIGTDGESELLKAISSCFQSQHS